MEIEDVQRIQQLRQEGLVLGERPELCEMLERDLALIVHDQEGRAYVVKPSAFKKNLQLLAVARKVYVRNGWGAPPF